VELTYALLAALGVSLLSLAGLFIVPSRWNHITEQRFLGFAAGVLLATASLQLLTEAVELDNSSLPFYALLIGIIGFFILERVFRGFHSHHPSSDQPNKVPGYLVIIGDGLHNLIDGLAIGVAFQINPMLGLSTTVAIAAHEIPQEIADYIVLRKSGFSRNRALLLNLASGLTAVLGVALAFSFGDILAPYQGIMLALTAGIFIYIAAVDIIPELSHNHPSGSKYTWPLLGGVLLIVALTLGLPHEHDHSQPDHDHSEQHQLDHDHESAES
jgi:zinc and cadmium transporter